MQPVASQVLLSMNKQRIYASGTLRSGRWLIYSAEMQAHRPFHCSKHARKEMAKKLKIYTTATAKITCCSVTHCRNTQNNVRKYLMEFGTINYLPNCVLTELQKMSLHWNLHDTIRKRLETTQAFLTTPIKSRHKTCQVTYMQELCGKISSAWH